MGSVFMSVLQREKKSQKCVAFFLFSFKRSDILTCKEQVQFTCFVSSVLHIKTGKASLLAVLLFIVGCLTCFSITVHSRERLSPL